MRRFFARPENINGAIITLDEGETRHLRDVLRIREGETVSVFDGIGNEFECRVEKITKRDTKLSVLRKIDAAATESPLDLSVCASVLKGDKSDFAIQKAVELGVDRFTPMISERCDVKPKDAQKRVERWRKIVLEASKQCGRAKLMTVGNVQKFDSLILEKNASNGHVIVFSEHDGEKFSPLPKPKAITAFFGPEGGWDDSELALARESGASLVTLNGRIMKADTAVIAISAILQHHFGDLN
ncbi:MAG: 16S rRNA (uracil(1498)-N(3))-methyltransferase [Pyrinomonadaceae bacterium]